MQVQEVRNGIDGWVLEEYEWSATTGVARFHYERTIETEDGKKIEVHDSIREQPCGPQHKGWY